MGKLIIQKNRMGMKGYDQYRQPFKGVMSPPMIWMDDCPPGCTDCPGECLERDRVYGREEMERLNHG